MTYKAIFYSACLFTSATVYSMNIQHPFLPLNMQPASTTISIKSIQKQELNTTAQKNKLRVSLCLFPFVAAATVTPILYYYLRYSEEDCCNC